MNNAEEGYRKAKKALTELLTENVVGEEFHAITTCLNAVNSLHDAYTRGAATSGYETPKGGEK